MINQLASILKWLWSSPMFIFRYFIGENTKQQGLSKGKPQAYLNKNWNSWYCCQIFMPKVIKCCALVKSLSGFYKVWESFDRVTMLKFYFLKY